MRTLTVVAAACLLAAASARADLLTFTGDSYEAVSYNVLITWDGALNTNVNHVYLDTDYDGAGASDVSTDTPGMWNPNAGDVPRNARLTDTDRTDTRSGPHRDGGGRTVRCADVPSSKWRVRGPQRDNGVNQRGDVNERAR